MEQDVTDRFVAGEARIAVLEAGSTRLENATIAHYADDALTKVVVAELVKKQDELAKKQDITNVSVTELTKKLDALTGTQKLQLEILQRLDLVAANPNVKIILAIVATVLASWAASKGLK